MTADHGLKPKFDFAQALRSEAAATTVVESMPMSETPPPPVSQPAEVKAEQMEKKKRKKTLFGKIFAEIGLSVGRPFRKFLLNAVHEKLDLLLQGLQRQETRSQQLGDLIEQQSIFFDQQSTVFDQQSKQILSQTEQAIAQLLEVQAQAMCNAEKLLRQIRALEEQSRARDKRWTTISDSLSARIDDLTIKTRGPIPFDDLSLAIRTVDGFVVAPRDDHHLIAMLIDASTGGLEPGTRKVIQQQLRPGATFIDVGAHIGLLSLAAARVVGASGKVYAFEAVPKTYGYLKQTIAINQLSDFVALHNEVVSSGRAERVLHVRRLLGHSSMFSDDPSAEAETIRVTTNALDNLIPTDVAVDLIKIDVEGAEIEVLEGMTRLLSQNPKMAIVAEFGTSHLALSQQSIEQWFDAFRSRGFTPFVIDELTGRLDMLFRDRQREVSACNILFLPAVQS